MKIRGVILDLDGTVYYGKNPVKGAAKFVQLMQKHGIKCLFVTNRANRTPHRIREHLVGMGIPCKLKEILTSAQATAKHLPKGSVYFIGERGLKLELKREGHRITDKNPDYVIVSIDRSFTFDKLSKACNLIINGAKFIATNPDKSLILGHCISPGTGALVAAVETACGRAPVCIGKPERLIMDMALKKLELSPKEVIAIGDNLATDIPAGKAAGMRTALILTGVSSRKDAKRAKIKPTWIVDSYEQLARIILKA